MTLSELDTALVPAALDGATTTPPLALGPTGTAFGVPVQVKVPFHESLNGQSDQITVMIMQEQTGCWANMPVAAVDMENNLAVVESSHFSILISGVPIAQANLELLDGAGVEACPEELVASAILTTALDAVPSTAVGLLTDPIAADVTALVTHPDFHGALRAIWVVELLGPGDAPVVFDATSLAATVTAPGDGTATVVVAGPTGDVRLQQEHSELASAWGPQIEPILRGTGLRFRLARPEVTELRVRARLHLRYEPEPNGTLPYSPVEQGKLLLQSVSELAGPPPVMTVPHDADCDAIADAIDPDVVAGGVVVEAAPGGLAKINVALALTCEGAGPEGAAELEFSPTTCPVSSAFAGGRTSWAGRAGTSTAPSRCDRRDLSKIGQALAGEPT